MPTGYKELLKDDHNGDTALHTASTAKEGVLQRLELPEQDNGRMSWGPDFATIRGPCGTRLQDGLLQPDQQLHRVCTLQITIPGEAGPHGGASLAEAGLHGMLDLSVLMKQHAQVGEGLAALQMLTSHLPGAIMVSSTKDNNLCLGDADGEAIGCTACLHGVQELLQPLCGWREQCNVIGIEQAGNAGALALNTC